MIGRVVGFDLGDRRIGVAVSDPLATLAEGRETILRDGESYPWRAIVEVVREAEAVHVVVGDPLHLDGRESERSLLARAFADELKERADVPVDLQDERLTSVQAERTLVEMGRTGKRKKKGDVDRMAARLILQTWLDTRAARESRETGP